jgi:membrane fusion protein (multidrug efflux system)
MREVLRQLVRPPLMSLLLAGAAGVAIGMSGCDLKRDTPPPVPVSAPAPTAIEVGVVQAWTSPIERTIQLVGSARAAETVAVTAQATGTVSWIGFEDEDAISAGMPMVRLDDRRVAAEAKASQARVDRLRLRLERVENAYSLGAANSTELDDARTALAEAEAEHERNAAIHSDHVIVAPFTGRVTRRLVSLGALVTPGTPIAVLNSIDPIEVRFSVPESYLADLRHGQSVYVRTAAYGDMVFKGSLEGIGAEVDPVSRSAEVYARLPNPEGLLRPGLFMVVQLVLDSKANAVLLPESALVVEGKRTEVFVVDGDKTVDRRRVTLGRRFPGLIEIAGGVLPGETVVTSGTLKLRQGTLVSPSPDQNLSALGVIAGLPLAEQPRIKTTPANAETPLRAPEHAELDGEG